MKLRSTYQSLPPPAQVDEALQFEVVNGLMSPDPVKQREAVGRYLHPDVTFRNHIAKSEGRWNVWKVFQADSTLFNNRLVLHTSALDRQSLKGLVFVDTVYQPRVPLTQWLLPHLRCPTIFHLTWRRQPDGSYLVTELEELISLTYLPNLLGPLGAWVHANIIQSLGRVALESVFETRQIVTALRVFIEKQFWPGPGHQGGASLQAAAAGGTR